VDPRNSAGTRQLSTRCSSSALRERRSFDVFICGAPACCAIVAGGTRIDANMMTQHTFGIRRMDLLLGANDKACKLPDFITKAPPVFRAHCMPRSFAA
jgi:hypothetical protein